MLFRIPRIRVLQAKLTQPIGTAQVPTIQANIQQFRSLSRKQIEKGKQFEWMMAHFHRTCQP